MKTRMKKGLLILGGSIIAIVLAVVVFAYTFDINPYKPRIEAAISDATGMNVRINGKIKLMIFPSAGVTIEDILIQNMDVDVVSVKRAEVTIKLLPLIIRKLNIRHVVLIKPRFFIIKDINGRFNFETAEKKLSDKEVPAKSFKAGKVFVKKGHFLYLDKISGGKSEAKECDLAIQNLSVGKGEFFSAISFEGRLSCEEVEVKALRISDVRVVIKAGDGKFEAKPITMKIFGGNGEGAVKGVMMNQDTEYSIDLVVTDFSFEEMLGAFKQKKSIRGKLDLKSHLTIRGKEVNEMTRTAMGNISLRSQNLFLEGIDLDRMLEKYEKSQQGDLVDLGAFLIAGPLGTVLTKGYDFGNVFKESLGSKGSTIQKMVSDWQVKKGIAEAEDVAFTTKKNRIALKGSLDFVQNRFDDVSVAVLNANGCAVFSQRIHGAFKKPQIDKPSILGSLLGPVTSLVKKPIKMLKGDRCKVFYLGLLKQP